MIILLRTFKRQDLTPDRNHWKNEYVFSVNGTLDDPGIRDFMYYWARFEASLHLAHVEYQYITAGVYSDYANMSNPSGEITLALGGPEWQPDRAGEMTKRDGLALKMRKPVSFGRHGASWLYHCVSDADVYLARDGRWRFVDGSDLYTRFYNGRFGLETLFGSAIMQVPTGAGRDYTATGFRPTRWEIDYVIEAHGRRRGRELVKSDADATFQEIAYKASVIVSTRNELNYWLGLGSPYVPEAFKSMTSNALGDAKAIAEKFHSWAECKSRDTDKETRPVARYGPTVEMLDSDIKSKIDVAYQTGTETLATVFPEPNLDGNSYFTLEQLVVMRDIVDAVDNLAGAYVGFDYTTGKYAECGG